MRDREEFTKLRNKFSSTEKGNFLKSLIKDEKKIKELHKAGLTEDDIEDMKLGLVPEGYHVHHKLPLDDGGTNDFDNLILMKNDHYHKVIINSQKTLTKDLKVGETKVINWPIPEGYIYPVNKN